MKALKVSLTAFFLFYLLPRIAIGQDNYGLIYKSFNVSQEDRTSVRIGKDRPICLDENADLSFEFRFQPQRSTYFGYLFRIVNKAGQNIDLIYNQKDDIFNVVAGAKFTDINFKLPHDELYDNWSKIRFHFSKNELLCFINQKLVKKTKLALEDRCFQIIFGASDLHNFSTTDVPPMQIRNIAIKNDGALKYFWPLNNIEGEIIRDSLRGEKVTIVNPEWAGVLHRKWKKQNVIKVRGNASYAFDQKTENLIIVAEDSILKIPAMQMGTRYDAVPSKGYHLFQGNQSFVNPLDSKLYNYYIDNKGLAVFDGVNYRWDKAYDTLENTAYGHTSRIFVPSENALYIFGGYGQLRYKNEVQKIDFTNKTWTEVPVRGDYFEPRYMAGIGRTGDSIYILGGYGSHDGDQRLNPRHYYNLFLYNIKSRSFKKIYDLPDPETPFVVAGSLIINKPENCYYALVYDESKYDTKLQLIKCSLTAPSLIKLADPIAYAFKDVISDADLFYCPQSKQLIAVTQLNDLGNSTTFEVYSIAFPPDLVISNIDAIRYHLFNDGLWLYTTIGALIILLLLGIIIRNRRKSHRLQLRSKGQKPMPHPDTGASPEPVEGPASDKKSEEPASGSAQKNELNNTTKATEDILMTAASEHNRSLFLDTSEPLEHPPTGLRIFLFGTFEMLNKEGEEISPQFSPLLKELFLMILLFTIKDGKGISTDRINDIFWGNKTGKNAKNNLSVNMVRLKAILRNAGDILILKESGRWVCDYTADNVWIDLVEFLQLKEKGHLTGIQRVRQIMSYISRGAFLRQTEYHWLDEIKADVNNKAIDELLKESNMLDPDADVEYIIEIANNIFHFDPLNEDALRLKCKSLYRIGRHSLAKNGYERFAKEFLKIYGEPFSVSFNEIVK